MKISLKLIQDIVGVDQKLPINEADIIERIGAQIGGVEQVDQLKTIYQQAIIVKVIEAQKIARSDHLNLCQIDDNHLVKEVDRLENGNIQVVCGADNVQKNQMVVWLPPGSVIPVSIKKNPIKLTSRTIMGVVSHGMLASLAELAIGDNHQGIVVLPDDIPIGTKLIDYLNLDDQIVDIENKMFTHRPDLFGQIGVAREICGIYGLPFKSPDWYRQDRKLQSDRHGKLKINNQIESSCLRFMAVILDNIKIESSPLWLQSYLSRLGIRPINNIVDVTNYAMMITGQPLHAYDRDKLAPSNKDDNLLELFIRQPKEKEQLKLIDGSIIELKNTDIVIADSQKALGLGGIMGGLESEVSDQTSSIVLECANFDMYSIRRSSMEHGLFSEAVTRFNKGQSPWQCPVILAYVYDLIKQICPNVELASEVADQQSPNLKHIEEVQTDLDLIRLYLGLTLDDNNITQLLNNVELNARIVDNKLIVTPPFYRTDLNQSEDIIEEIARLYGYDKLPQILPQRSIVPPKINDKISIRQNIRKSLVAAGANELLTYSFVDQKLLIQSGQDIDNCFKLANALSPELEYYRNLILPSLLKKIHLNHKAGYDYFCLFEMGKTHQKDLFDQDKLPVESERLAIVYSAINKYAKNNYQGPAYYQAKVYLDYLLSALGLDSELLISRPLINSQLESQWRSLAQLFVPQRAAIINYKEIILGIIGEFNLSLVKDLKLPDFCAGFEIDINQLLKIKPENTFSYRLLSKYPRIIEDLTINAKHDMSYQQVRQKVIHLIYQNIGQDMNLKITLIDIYQDKILQKPISWTFRIQLESYQRTLTQKEISDMLESVKTNFNDR